MPEKAALFSPIKAVLRTAYNTALSSCLALAADQTGSFPGIFPIAFFKNAASSYITSIQAFEIIIATGSATGTATITSVNTANSITVMAGENTNETNTGTTALASTALTSGTVVTATRNSSDVTDTVTVRGTIIEFVSTAIASVQYGTITLANGVSSNTATLGTSITTANSVAIPLGVRYNNASSSPANVLASVVVTNTNTITATRGGVSQSLVVGFCVVDFNPSVIQSIQQKAITLTSITQTDTDSISAVTTGNTLIIYGGISTTNTAWTNCAYRVELTSATGVLLTRNGTSGTTRTINYTALEFVSGIISTMQRGTTSLTGVASNDTAITAVANTARTFCNWCGQHTNTSSLDQGMATIKLLDSTHVRAEKNTATSNAVVAWEVAEFL